MARTQPTDIDAADAIKHFRDQGIKVQTAKAGTVRGEDGKERPAFDVKTAALAEEHIIGARDYGKSVTIVTLDGRRYEAAKREKQAA